jgi:anti-sigma regulatory factor (Ser/Thr protein kinase)
VNAPASGTLRRTYPAIAESGRRARQDVCALAAQGGAGTETIEAIRLAASEAVTNAVRHAYPEELGVVHLTAAVVSDEMWLLVSDEGRGPQVQAGAEARRFGSVPWVGRGRCVNAPATLNRGPC